MSLTDSNIEVKGYMCCFGNPMLSIDRSHIEVKRLCDCVVDVY